MAAKMPIIDPLGIIGKSIILPTRAGIGEIESFVGDSQDGYYVIVFFDGMSSYGALERNFITPELITDAYGVHIGTLKELQTND